MLVRIAFRIFFAIFLPKEIAGYATAVQLTYKVSELGGKAIMPLILSGARLLFKNNGGKFVILKCRKLRIALSRKAELFFIIIYRIATDKKS